MNAHEFLALYPAKSAEYLLAIGYLALFIPFWRYVQGARPAEVRVGAGAHVPALAAVTAAARAAHPVPQPTGWFEIPAGVHLHPGHAWARVGADGTVAVGADDFAHKLVGPAVATLPTLGAEVSQGDPAFTIGDGSRFVPMLSPVDGQVVAVNAAAAEARNGSEDPYGTGWLFKVKPRRLESNLRQLLEENAARRFLEVAGETLARRMSPELGQVLQDGGVPVHGIAREIEGEAWETLARRFFLT